MKSRCSGLSLALVIAGVGVYPVNTWAREIDRGMENPAEISAARPERRCEATMEAGAGGSQFVILDGSFDVPPTVLVREAPVYPHDCRRLGESGIVLIVAEVDESGLVQRARSVWSADADLASAAVAAVRHWRFTPARMADRAVAVRVAIPIQFQLARPTRA